MTKLLSEEFPEIYHYTTITGLKGIVESQTLWATHYAYLNDSEEIKHFAERLRVILEPDLESVLASASGKHQRIIDEQGGIANAKEVEARNLVRIMYNVWLGLEGNFPLAEPYITSFCTEIDERKKAHGLLSQWRGYGADGGYAIVFDTKRIEELLNEEGEKWQYEALRGGNVIYSSASDKEIEQEIGPHINNIRISVREFYRLILSGEQDPERFYRALGPIYPAIVPCSCRYKHWGFAEEKEVRIVAIPQSPVVREMAEKQRLPLLPEKPKKHFLRHGLAVPYIELFESVSTSAETRLPITRIIVGPHPEKDKRKKAVEILLQQHRIGAPVTISEIPYLG